MLNVGTFLKTAVPKVFIETYLVKYLSSSFFELVLVDKWPANGELELIQLNEVGKRVLQTKQRDAFVEYPS